MGLARRLPDTLFEMRSLLVTLLMLCLGCSAAPPLVSRSAAGTVRAHDEEQLELYSGAFVEFAARVKGLLESRREDGLEIWVQDTQLVIDQARAANVYGRIELGLITLDAPRYFMVHELVHWYGGTDSPYEGLPCYVEEGLADWIGCELTDRTRFRETEHRQFGKLTVQEDDLNASGDDFHYLPDDRGEAVGRLGFEVVRALGLERLKQMAKDGAKPIDYLNAAMESSSRLKRVK